MDVTLEFPFAEQLPKSDDPAVISEVKEMSDVWSDEGGLVPRAAMGELFNVSRQAGEQYAGRYGLKTWTFFGKVWLSMNEVKALHKIKRPTGFQGHSTAKMVRDCLADARKD